MRTIYLDGQFLKVSTQMMDAFTPGVFKAKGVFETMLGLKGVVLDAALHLKRLRRGVKILGLKTPAINPLILKEVLRCNHLPCARIRLMVWQAGRQMHVMAAALPYQISSKKKIRVCVIKTNRRANAHLAELKSLDYDLFAQAYARARARGFDEALLLNRSGYIFEASRANMFWIKEEVLYTTPLSSGCLNGITRQQIIKLAKILKIPVKQKNLTPKILRESDAAFLTNSLTGIRPIVLR